MQNCRKHFKNQEVHPCPMLHLFSPAVGIKRDFYFFNFFILFFVDVQSIRSLFQYLSSQKRIRILNQSQRREVNDGATLTYSPIDFQIVCRFERRSCSDDQPKSVTIFMARRIWELGMFVSARSNSRREYLLMDSVPWFRSSGLGHRYMTIVSNGICSLIYVDWIIAT